MLFTPWPSALQTEKIRKVHTSQMLSLHNPSPTPHTTITSYNSTKGSGFNTTQAKGIIYLPYFQQCVRLTQNHCTDLDLIVSFNIVSHFCCRWTVACRQRHVTKKLKACPWTHPQVPAVQTSLQVTVIRRHICPHPPIHLRRKREGKNA